MLLLQLPLSRAALRLARGRGGDLYSARTGLWFDRHVPQLRSQELWQRARRGLPRRHIPSGGIDTCQADLLFMGRRFVKKTMATRSCSRCWT